MSSKDFERIVPNNLFESGELKVLICYALSAVAEPVPATELSQLFHYDGIANYFDVQTTLAELEKNGYTKPEGKLLLLTEKGAAAAETLKETVSAPLRGKVYNAVVKMLGRYKSAQDTSVELTRNAAGCLLHYRVTGASGDIIAFQIQLPSEAQALHLKEKINEDPKYYCNALIRLLTENKN